VVNSVVIGARTVEQLGANLAAADLRLSAEEIARLTSASAMRQPYPARAVNLATR
jgi:aryl-alcohol dehydrogenase-like predicted oxidoreductase